MKKFMSFLSGMLVCGNLVSGSACAGASANGLENFYAKVANVFGLGDADPKTVDRVGNMVAGAASTALVAGTVTAGVFGVRALKNKISNSSVAKDEKSDVSDESILSVTLPTVGSGEFLYLRGVSSNAQGEALTEECGGVKNEASVLSNDSSSEGVTRDDSEVIAQNEEYTSAPGEALAEESGEVKDEASVLSNDSSSEGVAKDDSEVVAQDEEYASCKISASATGSKEIPAGESNDIKRINSLSDICEEGTYCFDLLDSCGKCSGFGFAFVY